MDDTFLQTCLCYCYRCYRKIIPNLLDYTCPWCESRFTEELIYDTSSEDESETTSTSSSSSSWSSLWSSPSSSSSSLSTFSSSSSSSSDQYDLPPEGFDQSLFIVSERLVFQTGMNSEDDHDAEDRQEQDMGSHQHHRTREPWGWHSPLRQGAWHERVNTLEEIFRQLVLTPTVQDMGRGRGRWGMLFSNMIDSAWSTNGFEAIIDQFISEFENRRPPTAGRARSPNRNKIKNLQKVKITEEHVEACSECTVCQEDYTVGENVRQLPCNHLFHYDCILPWLEHHDICPVCRTSVISRNTARNFSAYEE